MGEEVYWNLDRSLEDSLGPYIWSSTGHLIRPKKGHTQVMVSLVSTVILHPGSPFSTPTQMIDISSSELSTPIKEPEK